MHSIISGENYQYILLLASGFTLLDIVLHLISFLSVCHSFVIPAWICCIYLVSVMLHDNFISLWLWWYIMFGLCLLNDLMNFKITFLYSQYVSFESVVIELYGKLWRTGDSSLQALVFPWEHTNDQQRTFTGQSFVCWVAVQ